MNKCDLWGLIVGSTANGIFGSSVISGRVRTKSLLITFSLMGGLAVFPSMGFFVAPLSVVVLAPLWRILGEEHASVHGVRNQAA
jgi:predicted PurR-regulated permease PerM